MKQGDLSPIVGGLKHSFQDLQTRWDETQQIWNDQVSQRFAESHIVPLEAPLDTALKAMDRLAIVMMRAYEACSPDRE
ncbi:MAG: hypothetical protein QM775_27970 [Pirellulales bacterium]